MDDPRILYDSQSQCWVASAIDMGSWQVILAVCTNANNATNLTTGWNKYVLKVLQNGSTHSDFDTLGVDGNGIYLSVLQFTSNATHTIVAIKKPDIYQGTMAATYLTNAISNADSNLLVLQPAVNFDSVPSNGYAWFVAKGPANLSISGTYQGGAIYYRRLRWSGTNAYWADTNAWILVSSTNYLDYFDLDPTNANAATGISAPQSNNPVQLYAVGSRLAQATTRNGFLWTCHTVGLTNNGAYNGDASGSTVTRSGVQWFKFQINDGSPSLSLADYGRIFDSSPSGWYYYFPSVMVNGAGDMLAGFSGSTATNYMSALYSWRLSCGATNMPTIIQTGTHQTSSRAGDYSATTLDPSDDSSFWTVQEYGSFGLGVGWGTVVTKIRPKP